MCDNISNSKIRNLEQFCDLMIESGMNKKVSWSLENAVIRKEMRKPLYNKLKIHKPIWVTEAMTGKCRAVPTYVNAFLNGAEIIFDVGINAPGPKMSKKERTDLTDFIKEYDNFTAIKLKNNDAEFTYKDNSKKTLSLK